MMKDVDEMPCQKDVEKILCQRRPGWNQVKLGDLVKFENTNITNRGTGYEYTMHCKYFDRNNSVDLAAYQWGKWIRLCARTTLMVVLGTIIVRLAKDWETHCLMPPNERIIFSIQNDPI